MVDNRVAANAQENVVWIDIAKGIGIILVVYGHVARGLMSAGLVADESVLRAIDEVIYAFHMPLFFFLSGLFFLSSRYKRGASGLIANKIDTIFYPFVLWSLIQGSIEASLSGVTNGHTTWAEVFSLLWMPRAHFWFLYALLLIFIAATAAFRKSIYNNVAVAVLALVAYLTQDKLETPVQVHFIANSMIFFALGVIASRWTSSLARISQNFLSLGAFATIAAQALIYITHDSPPDHGGISSFCLALLGILSTIFISVRLGRSPPNFILTLGVNSMGIYLMHVIAASGARVAASKLLGIDDVATHLVVGCLAGLLLPLAAIRTSKVLGTEWLFVAPRVISLSGILLRYRGRTAKEREDL